MMICATGESEWSEWILHWRIIHVAVQLVCLAFPFSLFGDYVETLYFVAATSVDCVRAAAAAANGDQ